VDAGLPSLVRSEDEKWKLSARFLVGLVELASNSDVTEQMDGFNTAF